ncbi:hypothetical protein BV20DRAFT_972938 [Pilatotrama ljubarskyi]|nr:hypothetical protein BV20DRAFT_972938 [Pilatotrama ljubarskyi]
MLGVQDALGGSTAIYTWAVCGTGCSPSYLLSTGKQPSLLTNGQCLLYDASRACQSL